MSVLEEYQESFKVHILYFNTTLVSVLVFQKLPKTIRAQFQYNACVGSRAAGLAFGDSLTIFQYNACVGSRLKVSPKGEVLGLFQYNACVGSSETNPTYKMFDQHFNTTLVSVLARPILPTRCSTNISIQRLCRF